MRRPICTSVCSENPAYTSAIREKSFFSSAFSEFHGRTASLGFATSSGPWVLGNRVSSPCQPITEFRAAIERRRPRCDLADVAPIPDPPPALDPVPLRIIDDPVTRRELSSLAPELGDMIKAVVDIERGVMAIGGEMHADEEAALLDDGSRQADLWGINLYPAEAGLEWLEFDSMINVRPSRGNRSRDVEDPVVREAIRQLVTSLVRDA